MSLSDLAIRLAPSPNDWQMRVTLSNFLKGYMQGPFRDGFARRLETWLDEVIKEGSPTDVSKLHSLLFETLEKGIIDDCFLRTGRVVDTKLDSKAVCVVTHNPLPFWLSGFRSDNPADIRSACEHLQARKYVTGEKVGKPGDALWLTPLTGEITHLIDRAKRLTSRGVAASSPEYTDIASEARNLLGLSQYTPPICLIALVSEKTIGELLQPGQPVIMGPSVIEGRCHPRWRHWPELYGRAYQLNARKRAYPESEAHEAVRSPLPLDDVSEFVFLGPIAVSPKESDKTFAKVTNSDTGVRELLFELHALTGI